MTEILGLYPYSLLFFKAFCVPLLYSKHLEEKEYLLKLYKVISQKDPEDNFCAPIEVN